MAAAEMTSQVFFKLVVCIAVMTVAESTVIIHFHGAPPKYSRFTNAVFQYSVQEQDGGDACKEKGCSISCELDGHPLRSCPADTIALTNLTVNKRHNFILNVTTYDGQRNSSSYSWLIDTVHPTATLFSDQNYTSAEKVTVDVTFSESCPGNGGFECVNSSNCDVMVDGPAYVQPSSLRIIKPSIKYRLHIILSLKSVYGRVVVRMAENFCADKAGNIFMRTNGSILVIHFDRRPVLVDLWMPIPSYVLEINGSPRTVLATDKLEDLKIFLDFSIPIMNSTGELLNALHVNSGSILPIFRANHGNRKFVFQLKNVSKTEIITVQLEAGLLIGRTGTSVSPPAAVTVLYDLSKPAVGLSTNSPNVTKASDINVIVEFTKPVFGFEASMVKVEGGKLTRFQELSRALYSLTVLAITPNVVSISIPAGKVNDIAGNQNLESNQLQVKHYSIPAISMALHTFMTTGVLATTLAAAAISLSSASLGALGNHASGNINNVGSNPSMNLQGLFGHLQVFVLSDWLSSNHPIEYSETTKGLRWLIPRQKLPWKEDGSSTWPNHVHLAEEDLHRFPYQERTNPRFDLNLIGSSKVQDQPPFLSEIGPNFRWFHEHSINMKNSPYGSPLNSTEYFTYFLKGEPLSASNVVKRMVNYKGWEDMEMNLFWLGVGGGSLLIIHVLILIFLRWRIGASSHGILSVPRFEILLLILTLPCISQSSAFVMRGGTMGGIITGALLLVIPAAVILSVSLFLVVAIFPGSFAQYKEIRRVDITEKWYKKLWFFFVGRPSTGKWFFREGLPCSFLPSFGILFEDRKGPPFYVFIDQNDPSTIPRWTDSGHCGIGRMRALSSDDSNEEIKMPISRRILGCCRSSYIIVDLIRRISMGVMSGACSSPTSRESLFALVITLLQFVCHFSLRPYIRRGIHVVESISLLSEAGIFGLSIATNSLNPMEAGIRGYIMLALLFLTFVAQIINEWYALIKCILGLSRPKKNCFRVGLKFAAKGLVLPFLPRKHWYKVIPGSSQPKTGLSVIPPLSPETDFRRRNTTAHIVDPHGAMTATVVPVLSPGSPPGLDVNQRTTSTTAEATVTRERAEVSKGLELERKDELKKLRELAKASFSGVSRSKEDGSTSYRDREQCFSPGTSYDVKTRHRC